MMRLLFLWQLILSPEWLNAQTTPSSPISDKLLPEVKFSIDAKLDGVEGPYSEKLRTYSLEWPQKPFPLETLRQSGQVPLLRCYQTPGDDLFIGIHQAMMINAPLKTVVAILDDVDSYAKLFPGYEDIKIVSRDENRFLTFWEQYIPLFFVPNVKYQMIYQKNELAADRVIYRYQLKEAGSLKSSDGYIILARDNENRTFYVELDFFNADWGVAKVLGRNKIWGDAVEGLFLSDYAIKLKAEGPTTSYDEIKKRALQVLKENKVTDCFNPTTMPQL